MTQTTDTKALRDKHELALKDLTERLTECNRLNFCMDELSAFAAFSSTVIDQIKAERQRADELESSNDRIRQRWVDEVSNNCDAGKRVSDLEAELAALRGTQEPVGLIKRKTPLLSDGAFRYSFISDVNLPFDTELFTHPPKPVVVLPKFPEAISSFVSLAMQAVRRMDIQAMQEAGIVVKDGE